MHVCGAVCGQWVRAPQAGNAVVLHSQRKVTWGQPHAGEASSCLSCVRCSGAPRQVFPGSPGAVALSQGFVASLASMAAGLNLAAGQSAAAVALQLAAGREAGHGCGAARGACPCMAAPSTLALFALLQVAAAAPTRSSTCSGAGPGPGGACRTRRGKEMTSGRVARGAGAGSVAP